MVKKKGFGISDSKIDEYAKGVNLESLKKSRAIRAEFLEEFGQLPQSILIADRTEMKEVKDIITKDMGGGAAGYQKRKAKKLKGTGLEKTAMVAQGRTKFDVLSTFPQNLGRLVVKLYCPENGLVYDPFAGHNSRMELCFRMGRSYIGVDVSKKFMEANRKIQKELLSKRKSGFNLSNNKATVKLIEGSSHKVDLPNNHADFTLTSPPYWDIEYYGDEPEQLGNAKTYARFIELITEHVRENFRILKHGAYACWFINDFRKKGRFYPYHIDLYRAFESVGFEPFNIYIVDLGWPVNGAFVQDIINHKILPKRHEYCLVFRKPEK